MKQIIKTLLILIIAVFAIDSANAQDNQNRKKNRQEFVQIKAKHIAEQLKFDEATTEKFVETYCACEKEIWESRPDIKPNQTYATDAEAEAAIMARFDHSQKILDIRRKYYNEYKKFLTPLQIEEVYSWDHKMMNKLSKKRHQQGRKRHHKQQECPNADQTE